MTEEHEPRWLLYGAYGYTGRLIAGEALAQGHRPILAGRRVEALRALATGLAEGSATPGPLECRAFSLDDPDAVREGLSGVDAVLSAAGPFVHTAPPLLEACLETRTHYLDVTGEVSVFEAQFELDARARERGVAIMPGVGLDVIPTDAVAALLKQRLPSANRLELALHSPGGLSSGTLRTVLEHVPGGLMVRRDGELRRVSPAGRELRRWIEMGPPPGSGPMAAVLGGRKRVAPYTWGDLATAYRTTGIGNITCYMVTSRWTALLLPVVVPLLRAVFSVRPVRRLAQRTLAGKSTGPSAERRRTGRVRVWGRVEDVDGGFSEAVLELPESYRFTAEGGVRAMEELLRRTGAGADGPSGTLTPAGTFGVDWALGLPGVALLEGPVEGP